jgi:hypothetical protein
MIPVDSLLAPLETSVDSRLALLEKSVDSRLALLEKLSDIAPRCEADFERSWRGEAEAPECRALSTGPWAE